MKPLKIVFVVFFLCSIKSNAQTIIPVINDIPASLPDEQKQKFSNQKSQLESSKNALQNEITAFNLKCGSVDPDNTALVGECSSENNQIEIKKTTLRNDILEFNSSMQIASETVSSSSKYSENQTIKFARISDTNWKIKWNNYIADEITKHPIFCDTTELSQGVKKDIRTFYPDFFNLSNNQKIAFWTLLIASMAYVESNDFNLNAHFLESKETNGGKLSQGLLQLTYGNENNDIYKKEGKMLLDTKTQNIYDAHVNLQSGVIILASQLKVKGRLFDLYKKDINHPEKGGVNKPGYWSCLNINDATHRQSVINFFNKNASDLKK